MVPKGGARTSLGTTLPSLLSSDLLPEIILRCPRNGRAARTALSLVEGVGPQVQVVRGLPRTGHVFLHRVGCVVAFRAARLRVLLLLLLPGGGAGRCGALQFAP